VSYTLAAMSGGESVGSEGGSDQDFRSRVESYLLARFEVVTPMQQPTPVTWGFLATTATGLKILVGQMPRLRDAVLISSGLTVTEEHRLRFSAHNAIDRQRCLQDIALDLLRMNIQFSGLEDPPTEIWAHSILHSDGLTQDSMGERTLRVGNAIDVVKIRLHRFIGEEYKVEPFSIN
jgi:hypothetical protein